MQAAIVAAAGACEDSLPSVLAERRRLRIDKGGWRKWLELDHQLDKWLAAALPSGTLLPTHLSPTGAQAPRHAAVLPLIHI